MTEEITRKELAQLSELVEELDELNDRLTELSFDSFKVFDSNGDAIARVIAEYGDVRLEVGTLE